MGFCLYVAGGIFIQDIKLGLSIFSTPIGLLENVTILAIEAYQMSRERQPVSNNTNALFQIGHGHKV
jgi:hypothetical protein